LQEKADKKRELVGEIVQLTGDDRHQDKHGNNEDFVAAS